MKRFEYKTCIIVVTTDSHKGVNLQALNHFGKEGWEAVGVLDNERILLKREIQ